MEKNILLRYLRGSFVMILLYATYDTFTSDHAAFLKCIFIFLMYGTCYVFIQRTNAASIVRKISMIIFMLSIVSGFFFQGGLLGINSLDICLLGIVMKMVLSGKEKRIFLYLYFLQVAALAYVQIFHDHWIVDYRVNDPAAIDVAEVLARICCFFYIGYLYKSEFEKERAQLVETTERLRSLNEEISAQSEVIASTNNQLEIAMFRFQEEQSQVIAANKKLEEANAKIVAHDKYITGFNDQLKVLVMELKNERVQVLEINKKLEEANSEISAQSETIASYNKHLELMVEERTKDVLQLNKKLIEYSFANSHKTRGPLARVLGLIHLMKMEKGTDSEYLDKLELSALELDDIIREMTILLNSDAFFYEDETSKLNSPAQKYLS
ncbi:MAG TPA: hypothetical protein VL443_06155 [Cyclobacteriaceae bacterium]|nr:hypothetical protein [Cyclobacteriaceae bacterium]